LISEQASEYSTALIIFSVFGVVGAGFGWTNFVEGVYVSAHRLRIRGQSEGRTLAWSEIKSIRLSRAAGERHRVISLVLNDGTRAQTPLRSGETMALYKGPGNISLGLKPGVWLAMDELARAQRLLEECLAKSRLGPLQFE
jgi:hypothetical protein